MEYTFEIGINKNSEYLKLKKEVLDSIKGNTELLEKFKKFYKRCEKPIYTEVIRADDEDEAWERFTENFDSDLDDFLADCAEITDVDAWDEYEIEMKARARYEAQLEDEAMERYYESKYGDINA